MAIFDNLGGKNPHMFYEQDEDAIYLVKKDKTNHFFASGGVNMFDLNDLMQISPEDWEIEYGAGVKTAEITSNPFKCAITETKDTSGVTIIATTKKTFNLGAFNRFVMNGSVKGYLNNPTTSKCHGFSLVNAKTGNEDYTWGYMENSPTGDAISESTSISLDPTATYKIRITLWGYPGHLPSYFQFDDFRLYKE